MPNFYVSTTGNDLNDGKTIGTAVATVGQALTLSSNADTIYILDGTYTYNSTINITKEVTIRSYSGNRNNVILSKTTGGSFLFIQANNVTIQDITIQASATDLADALITLDSSSNSGNNVPTARENILITNNNLNVYKYGIGIGASKNLTITYNNFTRNSGVQITHMLVYYIRGTTTIQYNTFTDNGDTAVFVYLSSYSSSGPPYYDRINSKGGTLIVSNNIANYSLATTKPAFIKQDYFNTYNYGPIGSDANYNANTKLSFIIDSNSITANPTKFCDVFIPFLTSTTCLGNYNNVTISNNTLNYASVGMVKVDAGGAITIDSSLINITFIFYVYSNTITNFALRADYTGDQSISQQTSRIFPANLYLLENIKFIKTGPSILDQTITFGPLSDRTYVLGDLIPLAASASSGLPVSFASNNTDVVEVSGSTLIVKGTGSAIITASQSGNLSYSPAPNVLQSILVYKPAEIDPTTNAGHLCIGGTAINFLLISDGGAVLRYST